MIIPELEGWWQFFKVKTEFDQQFVSIFAVENNLKLTWNWFTSCTHVPRVNGGDGCKRVKLGKRVEETVWVNILSFSLSLRLRSEPFWAFALRRCEEQWTGKRLGSTQMI